MYRFINRNVSLQGFVFFLLFAYAIYLIVTGSNVEIGGGSGLSLFFSNLQNIHPVLLKIVVIVALILQLVLLQMVIKVNEITEGTSLYPSIWYMAVFVATKAFECQNSLFFVNLIALLLLLLNSNYETGSIKNRAFFSGILIGLAAFFDVASLWLSVFVIASLLVNRFSKAKEILLCFFGIFIPLIYLFSFYFFRDEIPLLVQTFSELKSFSIFFSTIEVKSIIYLIFEGIIFLYIIFTLRYFFSSKLVVMRRRLISVNMLAISFLLIILTTSAYFPNSLAYCSIPVALYFTSLQQEKKNWIFHWGLMLGLITFFVLICL